MRTILSAVNKYHKVRSTYSVLHAELTERIVEHAWSGTHGTQQVPCSFVEKTRWCIYGVSLRGYAALGTTTCVYSRPLLGPLQAMLYEFDSSLSSLG